VKVILALAIVALVAGFGVRWAKDKSGAVIHHVIDAGLPAKVDGRTWTPVSRSHAVHANRVRFVAGQVTSVRCHASLGSYSIHIDHAFAFQKSAAPVKPHCPGRQLRVALTHATRVDVGSDGRHTRLTFTDGEHHTVATLQAPTD